MKRDVGLAAHRLPLAEPRLSMQPRGRRLGVLVVVAADAVTHILTRWL